MRSGTGSSRVAISSTARSRSDEATHRPRASPSSSPATRTSTSNSPPAPASDRSPARWPARFARTSTRSPRVLDPPPAPGYARAMRQLWAVVAKEFVHIRRDPFMLVLIVGLPLLLLLLLGYALRLGVENLPRSE